MPALGPPARWGDRRRARIGLLGGSFNPAHAGHRHLAELALRRLRLDAVWLLVSPGNPLKPRAGMAPLAARLASARALCDGRRLFASGIESHLGTHYTVDTLAALRKRFPLARFVWLMGADNLAQLPRWRNWRKLVRLMPFAVVPRAPSTYPALAGAAARRLRRARLPARAACALAGTQAPAWAFLPVAPHRASSTAIRAARRRRACLPPN
jgi:nicotinate-nucleotide adenylyltransferase